MLILKAHLTKRHRVWVWVWMISGLCGYGDSVGDCQRFLCEHRMGMGIEIQSSLQHEAGERRAERRQRHVNYLK